MNSKLVGIAAEREVYISLGKRARPAGARVSRFKALSHSLRSTARRGRYASYRAATTRRQEGKDDRRGGGGGEQSALISNR